MKKRKFGNQIVAELVNNYPKEQAVCAHFLECGGCSLQDFAYPDQLKVKSEKVSELFWQSGLLEEGRIIDIVGRKPLAYRTRMDFVVSPSGFGLRRKRCFDKVVDLGECYLIENNIFSFLRGIYKEGLKLGLKPYDLKTHEGEWRYLSVRINEKNELMLIFVTKSGVEDKIVRLIEEISKPDLNTPKPVVKSIYHLLNDGLGDNNFGEVIRFWGEEYLEIEIADLKYKIGPNTFFQNNIDLFGSLLEKLLNGFDKNENVLDLFCGVGTLSLPAAGKSRRVLGIELMEESIELAKINAKNNVILNAKFVAGSVEDIIFSKLKDQNLKPQPNTEKPNLKEYDVLVLDPPRKGLEKVAERLLESDFEKIIYLSCNPLSLVKDLQILTKKWQIKDLSCWDLYPQTPHVECLVLMIKK